METLTRKRVEHRRRCAAIAALRSYLRRQARQATLPAVLASWRNVCRERRFCRRQALKAGLRACRAHARSRWAARRRLAIADLLAARSRLRLVWLPWQLLCFDEPPAASEMLVERWSAAAATPDLVRPLVPLCQGHRCETALVGLDDPRREATAHAGG